MKHFNILGKEEKYNCDTDNLTWIDIDSCYSFDYISK